MKAYPDKTRFLFVQLRARGISLGVISTQLYIPKSTLGDWDKSFADEIARLRAIEWEAVEEQFGRTLEQDLRAMAERIHKWEARIDRMNPDHFKVREVLAVLRETRREYFRRRAILMAPLENTLTRAVTRSLSRHPDESGRYTFLPPPPPRNTNDLQQPPTQPSGAGARPSPVPATPNQPAAVVEPCDMQINNESSEAVPSPGGCGTVSSTHRQSSTRQGEGDSVTSAAVQSPTPAQSTPQPVGVPSSDGSSDKINHGEAHSPSSFVIDSSLDIRPSSLSARGQRQGEGQTGSSAVPFAPGQSQIENPRSKIHSTEPNKTERSQQNGTTGPRHTIDLQQPESKSFDFSARDSGVDEGGVKVRELDFERERVGFRQP